MKIICIGQNDLAHIRELNSVIPSEPVFFLKPESALLMEPASFTLPDFSKEIHHEIEVVLKINRTGKKIPENSAEQYYDQLTVGIDFTARDIQQELKAKRLPWEKAKSFDGSACVGTWMTKNHFSSVDHLGFHLKVNGTVKQIGNTADLIFSFKKLIVFISQFMTLYPHDLIFTGTPAGVGPVQKGDILEGFLENEKLFALNIK